MTTKNISALVRQNVLDLKPYSSARDEYTSVAEVYIDANENPYNWEYNRYPDPYQKQLKESISSWKGVPTDHIFIGNGSDEVIDLLIRAFCEPGVDQVVALNPSYGMYTVSAGINNVGIRYFPLDADFNFDPYSLLNFLTDRDKILFLCSPNNPSGNCIPSSDIIQLCSIFNGLVVVDEAYIDFANSESLISQIKGHSNLVIIQTLSKAMGAAGIRLGMGFADPYIVGILNKIKPPYNVNSATQKIALDRVNNRKESILQIDEIKNEKKLFLETLTSYDFVLKIFSSEANFVLVRVKDADELYHFLSSNGIVVRNRNKQFRCEGCLRFTIGTPAEMVILNDRLLQYDTQQNKI